MPKPRSPDGDAAEQAVFMNNDRGEVVIDRAVAPVLARAQAAFVGAAESFGVDGDGDVQHLVDATRYGKADSDLHELDGVAKKARPISGIGSDDQNGVRQP